MSKPTFRFLILTEHERHSAENSVYALVSTLRLHPQCRELVLASRSFSKNKAFFENPEKGTLFGNRLNVPFTYEGANTFFAASRPLPDWEESFDVIWLRLPRPITDDFLYSIKRSFAHKPIINDPLGILETSTKAFLLEFPELCPPMQLCYSAEEIAAFAKQFSIVLKPLREYGGKGIVRVVNQQVEVAGQWISIEAYVDSQWPNLQEEGILAMKFLPGVSKGDKRLLVVGGKTLAASLRRPPEDSWICNVAQGGSSEVAAVDPDEQKIVDRISTVLGEKGIFICGIDTLVNDDGKRVLSEINTLSIGGFPQAEAQTGIPILQQTIDSLINYVDGYNHRS